MATVRITNSIRVDITSRIERLFTNRQTALKTELAVLPGLLEQAYEATYSKEERELAAQLRKIDLAKGSSRVQWVGVLEYGSIKVPYITPEGKNRIGHVSVQTNGKEFPVRSNRYSTENELLLTEKAPIYPEAARLLLEIDKVDTERSTLVASINGILNQCGTVRQLLDAWPSAINYLPKDVLDKHNEKTPKREKVAPIEVDDAVKSALLKATLLNSK